MFTSMTRGIMQIKPGLPYKKPNFKLFTTQNAHFWQWDADGALAQKIWLIKGKLLFRESALQKYWFLTDLRSPHLFILLHPTKQIRCLPKSSKFESVDFQIEASEMSELGPLPPGWDTKFDSRTGR